MLNYLFLIAVVFSLSSCCIQGKLEEAKRVVANAKDTLSLETKVNALVQQKASLKIAEGRIDSTILLLINKRVDKFRSESNASVMHITTLESLISEVRSFKKKYKKVVVPTLDSLRKKTSDYKEKSMKYAMIEEGLNIADYKLFDLAAFFGPGKFSVPEEMKDKASISFAPIVDSINHFSGRYKSIPRTATLIILGFADGTGFSAGPLVNLLSEKIGKTEPTKEELNQKLSELRAEELISFAKKRNGLNEIDTFKVDYIRYGKGEVLPLPTIKDYRLDDERRRIVLCYWAVLPD
jgi:hypothetical protein